MWGRRAFGRVLLDSEVYDVMSRPSRLLKQVRIPSNTPDFAVAISESLKDNFAIARSPERPNQFISAPARDIVILGGPVPETFATSIAAELTSMHGQFTPDFRVSAFETLATVSNEISVFFGRGVLAASDMPQVADLEFCAPAGGAKPEHDAKSVVPLIRAQSGHNANRPAAWYAGQVGLAIGFRHGAAPATILPEELGDGWEQVLPNLVLFFGRQNEADSIIRAFHLKQTETDAPAVDAIPPVVEPQFPDWYSRDGLWQWLDIGGRRLWFRLTNRTGASLFSSDAEMVQRRGREIGLATGLIIVKGLVLPRMPGLFDTYSGWRVDFQKDETLRHSEVAGIAWTAVAQTRGRYAIFSHGEGRWKGEEKSSTGDMVLPLGKQRRIELCFLDEIATGSRFGSKKQDEDKRDRIYPADSLVLKYAEQAQSRSGSMGAFLLPAADDDSRWERFVAEPMGPRRGQEDESDAPSQPISLDWINRAASVDGNVARGLAEFWLDRWTLEVRPTPGHLEVRVKFEHDPEIYRIENGGRGALGPLWIEYVWLNP
jgi:hypothetical protein